MSYKVPNKQDLRESILQYFALGKSVTETRRLLVETYGRHAPTERTCHRWFERFKGGDFDLKDKERSGQPKKVVDEELVALLNENPGQTLKELANILNIDKSTVSKRLKTLGMVRRQGAWINEER